MYPYIHILGKEIGLYNSMYAVGFLGMFLFCMLTRKKYRVSTVRAVIYCAVTMFFGVMGAKLMAVIYEASMSAVSHGEYIPDSGVCIFGALMFLPVFMVILMLAGGEKYRKLMDYMTPGIFFILGCAKMGCLLGGCCYGIADENGVFNHNLDYRVFPVQLYESLCTFAVVAVLLIVAFNHKKVRYGALYPMGTILYCSARFCWENFRFYEHDCEREFFMGLTYWQCWALTAIVISAVWLIVLYGMKKFKECDLGQRDTVGMLSGKISDTEKALSEKNRKKHAEKAKAYKEKAKKTKKK